MLAWFKQLIHLRRHSPSLNDGDTGHVHVTFDEEKRWLMMERGQIRVMCNLGNDSVDFDNPAELPIVLASNSGVRVAQSKVALPPNSLAIVSGEKS